MAGFFAQPFFNNAFFKLPFFHRGYHKFFAEPFFDDMKTSFPLNALARVDLTAIYVTWDKPVTGVFRDEDFTVGINGGPDTLSHIEKFSDTLLILHSNNTFGLGDVIHIQIVPHLDNNLGELPHTEITVES